MSDEFDYDEFLAEVEKAREAVGEPCMVVAPLDQAREFAAWCVENGFEEPEIHVVEW